MLIPDYIANKLLCDVKITIPLTPFQRSCLPEVEHRRVNYLTQRYDKTAETHTASKDTISKFPYSQMLCESCEAFRSESWYFQLHKVANICTGPENLEETDTNMGVTWNSYADSSPRSALNNLYLKNIFGSVAQNTSSPARANKPHCWGFSMFKHSDIRKSRKAMHFIFFFCVISISRLQDLLILISCFHMLKCIIIATALQP